MQVAMATTTSSSLVTGLRCRTGAAVALIRPTSAAGDRRGWRTTASGRGARRGKVTVAAACKTCKGKGAVECPGCKGTGKNKKNGNIFERWKCFDCQGFGLKSCPTCGKGGLTPEQRGER
ncbi:uncharacterized protein LOC100278105 [Zea mays]|uniref:Uncharacterized protein n=1 Tax=Zea mays TaxID=4577 RepID=B6U3Z1_MAIZE|nr:uncharacterized protein LOC100278105 [Zea mays]ACG44074.1 hypothetical protein [Zea mays]AQK95677.1 hypothetical protein ZEAMMB73_Zm00001d011093 [Zea mays]|eukprot:NP_001144962.1 uncharacterized protein LOC100278105 [Zea mays]